MEFSNIFDNTHTVKLIGNITNWKPVTIIKGSYIFYNEIRVNNAISIFRYCVNGKFTFSPNKLHFINTDGETYNYIIHSKNYNPKKHNDCIYADYYLKQSIIFGDPEMIAYSLNEVTDCNIDILIKIFNKGYSIAAHHLSMYYEQIGEFELEKEILLKAANKGDMVAMIKLGDYYVKKYNDYDKAVECWNKAKDAGLSDAIYKLHKYYNK